jgi:hypothetical protein
VCHYVAVALPLSFIDDDWVQYVVRNMSRKVLEGRTITITITITMTGPLKAAGRSSGALQRGTA